MPGIVGFQGTTPGVSPQDVLERMIQPLRHESYYEVLPVVAPPQGAVAVVGTGSESRLVGTACDGQVSVAYFGEFYDAPLSTLESGTEIAAEILRLYRKHQRDLPRVLDGSYTVYVAELETGATLLFNDHCASRQMFYTRTPAAFAFAPELKGLTPVPDIDLRLNRDAVVCFLVNGSLLADTNFYQSVQPLRPGRLVAWAGGQVSESQWFAYEPDGGSADRGEAAYIDELSALLRQSVLRRFRDPARTMIPLSGGIDSRGILAICHEKYGAGLRTVTWGKDNSTPGADADVARTVARHLQTDHQFILRTVDNFEPNMREMLWRMDGLTDDACHHHGELSIMKTIREELNCHSIMRGEECFGHWPEAISLRKARIQAGVHELAEYPNLLGLISADVRAAVEQASRELVARVDGEFHPRLLIDRRDHYYYYQRMFHYHSHCAYFKYTVLDVKSPWMDRPIIEFLARLPSRYRLERELYRKCLATMFPQTMAIPTASVNSLENWNGVIQSSPALQQILRQHLIDGGGPAVDWLDRTALARLTQQAFQPGPSHKPSPIMSLKGQVRKLAPGLYRWLTKAADGRMNLYPLPAATILFRSLQFQFWLQKYPVA